jgi:putative membrane protein
MPMKRSLALAAGILVLICTWAGPFPSMVPASFTAHMAMHMSVVAVAAPLLGYGLAGQLATYRGSSFLLSAPMAASLADLVIIWVWHTPLAHEAARTSSPGLVLEQASFLMAGVFLWLTVFLRRNGGQDRLVGAGALLFTSMHMTLLGVLISLATKPICSVSAGFAPPFGLSVMDDQQVGGLLMLGIGGSVYLVAGLSLVAGLLGNNSRTKGGEA